MEKQLFRTGEKVLFFINDKSDSTRIGIIKSSSRVVDGIFYRIEESDGFPHIVHESLVIKDM